MNKSSFVGEVVNDTRMYYTILASFKVSPLFPINKFHKQIFKVFQYLAFHIEISDHLCFEQFDTECCIQSGPVCVSMSLVGNKTSQLKIPIKNGKTHLVIHNQYVPKFTTSYRR